MKSLIKKQEDGTIEITITLPWTLVKKTRDEIIDEHVKTADISGFRKGKAPKDIVEKNLNKAHLQEETLRKLLSAGYLEALKEHKITPVLNPKIHVEKLEDGKDWVFNASTAEKPEVKLGDYKQAIKKITAKTKIIIPGKEPQPISFEEISAELLKVVTLKIPKIIIDSETERLLAQTLDEVKRLGLTLDQYLASTGKNVDSLKADYEKKAESDIKIEFILGAVAETESIVVEDKEIEEAINQSKNEAERQNLESNRYLLASIIRQQKTLDFIKNL